MSRYNHNRYQSNDRQASNRSYNPARYESETIVEPKAHSIPPRPAQKTSIKSKLPVTAISKSLSLQPGKLIQDTFSSSQNPSDKISSATTGSGKPAPKRSSVLYRSAVAKPGHPLEEVLNKTIEKPIKNHKKPLFHWRYVGASIAILFVVGGVGSLTAVLFHSTSERASNSVLSEQASRTSGIQTEQSVYVSEEPVSDGDKEKHRVADHEPKRVFVDHVGLDARIHRAGVNRHNQLIMPSNVHDVNWYEGSRAPGKRGAVLLSGYVSGPTERGALYYTRALEHGDIITIENGDGTTHKYEVFKREFIPYDKVDLYELLVPYERGKNTLHILAADDRYNVMSNGFQDRIVIYAVEVE